MAVKGKLIFRKIITFPIYVYKKFISPALPKACLYEPTCSEYSRDAMIKHGMFKGIILGTVRIFRCNSLFFTGGMDPVPEKFSFRQIGRDYKKFGKIGKKKS